MTEKMKTTAPVLSALHTELLSSPGPLAKELQYVGADREQPQLKNHNEIIANAGRQINPQAAKSQEKSGTGTLQTVSMTELYDTVYPPKAPVVDDFLFAGTYLFVGAPKVGKSFFMAQLSYHVAMGLPLWGYQTHKGTVLYLALEDDYARLQRRLSTMFGVECADNLFFATKAKTLKEGLDNQLEAFVQEHADARLIIIDTLQKIREIGGDRYSYASDYEIVTRLKAFSDRHNICLLIVHHTRKMESEDSFDMISGTNGLLGAADGAFIMQKKKRTDKTASMDVAGRDQPDQRLTLEFEQEQCIWQLTKAETELWKAPPDPVLEAISRLLTQEVPSWTGSSSELLAMLPGVELPPNVLTRKLNVDADRLYNEYSIRYESGRTHAGRMVSLTLLPTEA